MKNKKNILSTINSPTDLKKVDLGDLDQLAGELREHIIDVISSNPGHLASSLGVVELSIALHFVFQAPYDKIIWDVGHQAYPHKILTGRRDAFKTNRKLNGISGFPKMSESEYDAFGVGHASTSISAALGMAVAAQLKGESDRHHIAVIGDGAMTGGMAIEGLNNAGVSNANLLVILNDNGISIDEGGGALHKYLIDISTSRTYNRIKARIWRLLGSKNKYVSKAQQFFQKVETAIKVSILSKSNLFESLNFRYFGPEDGHNIIRLIRILNDLKEIPGPKILHIITKKGKGLNTAERDPVTYHAPSNFDKKTGELLPKTKTDLVPKYQDVFGETLVELAEQNEKIVGITPAMPTGSSLNMLIKAMPHRAFDVGIAEQHALTFSAGLAAAGMKPFCVIYSTFLQRAYDQIIHDVALQKLPVVFCIDRAGLVGEDGATHHGAFDFAYLRAIPNMVVSAPMNENELRNLMYTAEQYSQGPFAIRYPRGRGVLQDWKNKPELLPLGKARMISDGEEIAILSLGHVGNFALEAIKESGKNIALYDMRFLKPLDEDLVHGIFAKFKRVITVEDGSLIGGLASAVAELKSKNNYKAQMQSLGIPDQFIEQGKPEELHKLCGFDVEGILKAIHAV
ncbi:MAG: 1-deoxy-D-xylulose-5-phosphate synthase [Bacteroidales bacterium]|nr:1-deoxy-D-xylulose-5-phosphate synthase [Bacteroidales bacterium]